jgi:general nucleoside transport system permease protein
MAALHAVFAIHLRADQIVSGTAMNILALGITTYAFRSLYGDSGTPDVERIPNIHLPIKWIPWVGDVFDTLNLMTWLMLILVVLSWFFLFKTPWGLRLRAVGEHPRAADTVGIPVFAVRYAAVITSGALAALGGAYLSFGLLGAFSENMTAGRGFIALAALIFGKWKPYGLLAAALLFGFARALGDALQSVASISADLVSILPYALTLVALVGLVGRSTPPAADGIPYKKQ